jgi:hypothetical protein
MTEAELKAIKENASRCLYCGYMVDRGNNGACPICASVPLLLAEIRRLRGENADLKRALNEDEYVLTDLGAAVVDAIRARGKS